MVRVHEAPVVDVRPLLPGVRRDLVDVLRAISDDEWVGSTAVPGWRVKDIALHLLDDDLGRLSRTRDDDRSGLLPPTADPRDFVATLDAKNQRWVDGAAGLSRRVVSDLLVWAGRELADHDAAADLTAPAFVSWAADVPVPAWLDLAREFTEQWVHQQQIREAVRLPGTHGRHLDRVLRTFVWAYPHQLGRTPDLLAGAVVALDLGDGRHWDLVRLPDGWELEERPTAVPFAGVPDAPPSADTARHGAVAALAHPEGTAAPHAVVSMAGDVAWRVLTGAPFDPSAVTVSGDTALVDAVLAVRGVLV